MRGLIFSKTPARNSSRSKKNPARYHKCTYVNNRPTICNYAQFIIFL